MRDTEKPVETKLESRRAGDIIKGTPPLLEAGNPISVLFFSVVSLGKRATDRRRRRRRRSEVSLGATMESFKLYAFTLVTSVLFREFIDCMCARVF